MQAGNQLCNVALQIARNLEPYFVVGMTTAVVTYNYEHYKKYGNFGLSASALTPRAGDEFLYAQQVTNPKYTLPPARILAPFYPKFVALRLAKNGLLTYLIVFNQYMQRMLEEMQTALDEDRDPTIEGLPDPRPYALPALFSTFRETLSLFVKGIYELIVRENSYPKTAWILMRDYAHFAKETVLQFGRWDGFLKVYFGLMQTRILSVAADATVAIMINIYRAIKNKKGAKYFFKSVVKVGVQSVAIVGVASLGATVGNTVYVRWGCILGWMGTELLVFFVVESMLEPWVQQESIEGEEKKKEQIKNQ